MSVGRARVARMFDGSLAEPAALSAVSDGELIGAIQGWARASAAADARRLAAIAELALRRCGDVDDERHWWVCDPTASAAAEVAAALNIGHGRGVGQLRLAVLLRDQLPKINALFMAGSIDYRMVNTLRWRTLLVEDDAVLAALDAALAGSVTGWGPLSDVKLEQKIDAIIEVVDPEAVRRLQTAARSRDITFGDPNDATGTTSFWGRLLATDAAIVKQRLDVMAHGVCKDDPRTLRQRLADALGALGAGSDHLACRCGAPSCPAAGDDRRATNVLVHIVADPTVLDAVPDPGMHGEGSTATTPATPPEPTPEPAAAGTADASEPVAEPEPAPPTAPVAEPVRVRRPGPGIILGGAIVPAPLLAELIRDGATVRYVSTPGPDAESHYRPSAKLAEFVWMRDMTCRHPGCDRPADLSDIDHTLPWPHGATHPSDLKCYCRIHHLLKTHWSGDGGWSDRQFPDGRVEVMTPSGRTFTTKPGSALLFPGWDITTTEAPPTGYPPKPPDHSGLGVPKRKRTRAQDHAYRITAERERNAAIIAATRARAAKAKAQRAQRNTSDARNEPHTWKPAPPITANNNDPPPF